MGRIRVRVTPNSRVEKFAVTNDEIHAWVSGPPVDGRANRRLIELLADGKWTATEASLPANGGKRGESRLDAASCGEVESCVALGDYSVGERTEGLIDAG